jgi:CPA2 family monovalent cation:H+ antiporter-2
MGLLHDAFIYLLAAVVAVPISNRLGLGSVLGYLIAGIAIGPVLGVIGGESEDVRHFAEFGVVMMLFIVGLELRPSVLWNMRSRLVGLGGLQVIVTTAAFSGLAFLIGQTWQSALAIGMILALSSTAIVLQTFNEKSWMKTDAGQSGFAVLLFQDIAVIPMLALLPLLAISGSEQILTDDHHATAISGLPGWLSAITVLGVVGAIILGGRYLIRPVFRFIASSKLREIFTAAALLLVVGIALLMELVGLSPALGTFLAGVVLSDSEYRHELESDIAPFKGLLLGLFFISVGAGMEFGLLLDQPGLIVAIAAGILVIKFTVLVVLGRIFNLDWSNTWLMALGLAQAGEFAFVLFSFAGAQHVLDDMVIRTLSLSVAITMMLTPLLFIIYEKIIAPRLVVTANREADEIDETGPVIIAGVGRFGQIISRLLLANGYPVTLLEQSSELVDLLRKVGVKTYYGDATRPDLLEAAGIAETKLFVAALDDRERQTELVTHIAREYPKCRIFARALDRHHIYELERAGAHFVKREIFDSALNMGREALVALGTHPFRARKQSRLFRAHDLESLHALRENWHDGGVDDQYIDAARARTEDLFGIMKSEGGSRSDQIGRGWTPPPKSSARDVS